MIVIILDDYKAIDIKCRQHYEFNSKFKSILAKKALSKDYFENIRQHYKWSEALPVEKQSREQMLSSRFAARAYDAIKIRVIPAVTSNKVLKT